MFSYPALLWFFPLLLLVILIHLIHFQRHRRIPWAAMEFLLISYRRSKTRLLFKQILLLLLRLIAVAALILMFANWHFSGTLANWFGTNNTHHIILLDDSYSMNDSEPAAPAITAFDSGISVVRKIIADNPYDTLTLITSDKADSIFAVPIHSTEKETFQQLLAKLKPSNRAISPEILLFQAADYLHKNPQYSKSVIYLLSDFRQQNWKQPEEYLNAVKTLQQAGAAVRMIRLVDTEHPNLTVEKLELVEGIHAADVEMLLDATVTNNSKTDAEKVAADLYVDNKIQTQLSIPKIPAGKSTLPPLRIPVRIKNTSPPTPHRIELRLQGDAVPNDNSRFLVLQVPDSLNILLITDAPQDKDVQYVRQAVSPSGMKSGIITRVEPPVFLTKDGALNGIQGVILLDTPALEPAALKTLEDFAAAGGGVCFFTGEKTDIEFVRQQLYKDGSGLFPVLPVSPQTLLPDLLSNVPDIKGYGNSVFKLFQRESSVLLQNVRIEKYLAVEPPKPEVNILAELRNSSPLAVEKKYGKGRTVTFLTTAAPDWNNWGRGNPSYVVVLLQLVAFLTNTNPPQKDFLVGEKLTLQSVPGNVQPQTVWKTPQKETLTDTLDAMLSGFYEAVLKDSTGEEMTHLMSVNVDPSEGDIRLCGSAEIAALLRPLNVPVESAEVFQTENVFTAKQPAGDYFLYVILLCLIGETFLAGRIVPPLRNAVFQSGKS